MKNVLEGFYIKEMAETIEKSIKTICRWPKTKHENKIKMK